LVSGSQSQDDAATGARKNLNLNSDIEE